MFNNKRIEKLEMQLSEAIFQIGKLKTKLERTDSYFEAINNMNFRSMIARTDALASSAGKHFTQPSSGECLIDAPKAAKKPK